MAFRIKHSAVGPFPQGRVVSVEQLEAIPGMDVDRLLNMDALEIVQDGAAVDVAPLPPGPEHTKELKDVVLNPDGTQKKEGDDEGDPEQTKVDYTKLNKADLLAQAKEHGLVNITDQNTKAEIIDALVADDAAKAE